MLFFLWFISFLSHRNRKERNEHDKNFTSITKPWPPFLQRKMEGDFSGNRNLIYKPFTNKILYLHLLDIHITKIFLKSGEFQNAQFSFRKQ